MNTYADILYAYGAYVHGSQYSRRSQIRLIARLQSRNGTRYCSSGSQWKRKQIQHSSQQKQHNRKSTQHIICIYSSVAISDGLYYQCANTTAGCEHQKQQKQKQQNRNSTQHRIIVHLHPLLCRSIVVRIGARTLHLSRHLASVFAPCIFLVCLSDGRTGSLCFELFMLFELLAPL